MNHPSELAAFKADSLNANIEIGYTQRELDRFQETRA